MDDATVIVEAFVDHKWLALAILIIGFVVRLLKSDTKFPINIPSRWLPVATLALGQVYAFLHAISSGQNWKPALVEGLVASFTAMGLFDVLVKALRDGKDMKILPKEKSDDREEAGGRVDDSNDDGGTGSSGEQDGGSPKDKP